MRCVEPEYIFSAMKRIYGENTLSRSKEGLIAERYQRFQAYNAIKCYAESKGDFIQMKI